MSGASLGKAVLALVVGLAGVGLAATQAGFPVVGGGIGVLVGVPGAYVELLRALLPIVVALLFAAVAIRFGIRALRTNVGVGADLARGGKLVGTFAWAAFAWLTVEVFYRLVWLGGATLFGNLSASLVCSAVVVALCFAVDRMVPWSRMPEGIRHLGLAVLCLVALFTAQSAWSHRGVVSHVALLPVALVGLAFVVSGTRRVESGPRLRMLVELGLASFLLSGPLGSFLS
jgi:hypothetical protein